jgi:hypothetical protein
MMLGMLIFIVILGVIFHWALGWARERHDLFMVSSSGDRWHTPSVQLEDDISTVLDGETPPDCEVPSLRDHSDTLVVKHEVPPPSPRMIRSCGTCGRQGRRRRNGKPYCFDCESEPWLWE